MDELYTLQLQLPGGAWLPLRSDPSKRYLEGLAEGRQRYDPTASYRILNSDEEEVRRLTATHDITPLCALWTEHDSAESPAISSEVQALKAGGILVGTGDGPSVFRLRAVGNYLDMKELHLRLAKVGGDWDALKGDG